MNWTTECPAKSGFYWYRSMHRWNEAEVVFYDAEMKWVQFAGSDVPVGECMTQKIDGVFWPEQLQMP
jgi:hypothetical protein